MDITIFPGKLRGNISIIPSKSQAHRLLICAAFADRSTRLRCPSSSRDMDATADCLRSLGASIDHTEDGYQVTPIRNVAPVALLPCRDSGSTLRFLLPIVGALGVNATFQMEGRLPMRPLSPLWEEMERMGCTLSRPTSDTILCTGKLRPGNYRIDGSVSSQFITGLLFALSLLEGKSELEITGKPESAPYIEMTRSALSLFHVDTASLGGQPFLSPGDITIEGDWSNGAFFLAANLLGSELSIGNLNDSSLQGDRAITRLLPLLAHTAPTISAADIPDLVPILAVVAGAMNGAIFTDIRRLRLKESDRVSSVLQMLKALGGDAKTDENTLTVFPRPYTGGTVDACNDHRIAMAAAIAATVCRENVTICGAQAVEKSYPQFWAEYRRLGGHYEQYLR